MGILRVALVAGIVGAAACAQQQRIRSSVVDYLYPDKDVVVQESIPTLRIPAVVGIAFAPENPEGAGAYNWWTGKYLNAALSETQKTELLESVAAHFRQSEFVKSIEIVPSAYLRPKGGFTNLDQVRSMFGVDIIALVSYDQIQFTSDDAWSATYWTLIGAYVVPGTKNDTHTMMDTAVFDIASRKLLFRAPATSMVKGKTTPIKLDEQLRADRAAGFAEATGTMIRNLDQQLALFKEKVKARPQEYKVVAAPSPAGGGPGGALDTALLAGLLLAAVPRRRQQG